MIRALLTACLGVCLLLTTACSSESKKDQEDLVQIAPTKLRVAHQVGGAHRAMLVRDGRWYQCHGCSLLVVHPRSVQFESKVELGQPGEFGPACDIAAVGDRMYVVLQDDAVVELELSNPSRPTIELVRTATELGIRPRTLSVAAGEVYVCGGGGVLRWSDRRRFLRDVEDATSVGTADAGLVATSGRRVLRLEDGEYLGAASRLWPVESPEIGGAAFLFALQATDGATVGLMNGAIREIQSRAVHGQVRSVRFFDHRLWVATDREAIGFALVDGRLIDPLPIKAIGVRDLAYLEPNRYAIAADVGRGIYRPNAEGEKPGEMFAASHREPGHLIGAMSDGRRIVAGAPEATWVYLIGSSVEVASKPLERTEQPQLELTTVDGKAKISKDLSVIVFGEGAGEQQLAAPGATRHECMASVEGDIWVGHDRGVSVFRRGMDSKWAVLDSVRLDGPVLFLFPERLARGASYVSEFGGMGLLRFETPVAPVEKEK
jgi:hypothetical protein